jgi:hypothetical protein
MKKLLIFAIILFSTTVWASPFLVADPPPAEQEVTSYNIYVDSVLVGTFDGEVLNYDLEGMTPGVYSFTAEGCNAWGCSTISNPYISPALAGELQNMRMNP